MLRWQALGLLVALTMLAAGCAQGPSAQIRIEIAEAPAGTPRFTFSGSTPLGDGGPTNAFDQLEAFAAAEGIVVESTYYDSMGSHLIDSINGVESRPVDSQDSSGAWYYWRLFVDGEAASGGADQVELVDGMHVRWSYGR